MTRSEIREAIKDFFTVFDAEVDADTRERDLRFALDRLSLASHFAQVTPDVDTQSSDDVPATSDQELRERLGLRFPGLGYYSVSLDSKDLAAEKPGLGDALDDLVDIALDLEQVLRRWEFSEEDALWHFGFLFGAHWGQHLRALQLHLHERAFR